MIQKEIEQEVKQMNKWDLRFIAMAELISTWSSCLRRNVGALIVKNGRVIATGYNGTPSGVRSCAEKQKCLRNENNIESGTHAEFCYATHAEQNAICQAAKLGISVDDCTLYCTHSPCSICAKMIINCGIKRVVYKYDYPDDFAKSLLIDAGIEVCQI